jgi:lactoylglutathione lyase
MGRRLAHTMIRVFDLEASLDFYVRVMEMALLRSMDFEDGRYTLAYLGYGPETDVAALELTHNWDQAEPYAPGTAYGHVAVVVDDVYAEASRIEQAGGRVIRAAGPMKGSDLHIAFVEDPDGYKIELIQAPFPPPLS